QYEFICQQWEKEPSRFIHNPHHQIMGLNINRSEIKGDLVAPASAMGLSADGAFQIKPQHCTRFSVLGGLRGRSVLRQGEDRLDQMQQHHRPFVMRPRHAAEP
uniref:hypothetical protein n=1 Tax=Acidomonas methanolica TaxID=437 RepID=UPI0021C01F17